MHTQNRNDLMLAIVGGLTFAVVWIILELIVAADPSLIDGVVLGIAGGAAWFVGTVVFRKYIEDPEAGA